MMKPTIPEAGVFHFNEPRIALAGRLSLRFIATHAEKLYYSSPLTACHGLSIDSLKCEKPVTSPGAGGGSPVRLSTIMPEYTWGQKFSGTLQGSKPLPMSLLVSPMPPVEQYGLSLEAQFPLVTLDSD
jgi:hypothetical protein